MQTSVETVLGGRAKQLFHCHLHHGTYTLILLIKVQVPLIIGYNE